MGDDKAREMDQTIRVVYEVETMFAKILSWIREVLNKMINQSSVKQSLGVNVAITPLMAEALTKWSLMYTNQATWLSNDVKSLNLPATIAAEIARAVTIEMDVEVSGSPRADFLHNQMDHVVDALRRHAEYAMAKGGMMLKPYIAGDGLAVDFVQADQFYPVAFDSNGHMTACVFSDQKVIGQSFFTRLEYHAVTPDGYRVTNAAFKSSSQNTLGTPVNLNSVEVWQDIQPETIIQNVDRPLFAYFKTPFANNIDPTSPLGVSCYSRACDLIEQADRQWSDLLWEFESGKRALYVDELAFDKDTNRKPILPNKRLYRTLKGTGKIDGETLFEDWTPTIREVNILNGLDAILKKIEFNCGLAQGTISDPSTVALTATEIKMSRQRTYATITDTQKALEDALEGLLYAMDVWTSIGNLAPKGTWQAVYTFDDSIVADHDTQFLQDTQAVTLGTMSKVEWRMRQYGETLEMAQQALALITTEQQPTDFFAPNA